MSDVVTARIGVVQRVAIARPAKRNALTADVCTALASAIAGAAESGARAVVLHGEGGHFCVGGDLGWLLQLRETGTPAQFAAGLRAFQDLIRTIVRTPVPVIAALHGSAAGFGLDLALACDYRIAGESAQLTSAFAKMGLVPDGGSSFTLTRLLAPGQAFRFLVGGEVLTAARARELGLVDDVTADADVLDAAGRLAEQIAAQPASSVGAIKTLFRAGDLAQLDAALEAEGVAQGRALAGPDFAARAAAFLAKRKT